MEAEVGDVESVPVEPGRVRSTFGFLGALGLIMAVLLMLFAALWPAVLWIVLPSWGSEAKRTLDFDKDRDILWKIVKYGNTEDNASAYYTSLPPYLSDYTASGLITVNTDSVFIPLWSGIPDDAGGYWYSPNGSPHGYDMWGMACSNEVHLEGPWWVCGMSDSWMADHIGKE